MTAVHTLQQMQGRNKINRKRARREYRLKVYAIFFVIGEDGTVWVFMIRHRGKKPKHDLEDTGHGQLGFPGGSPSMRTDLAKRMFPTDEMMERYMRGELEREVYEEVGVRFNLEKMKAKRIHGQLSQQWLVEENDRLFCYESDLFVVGIGDWLKEYTKTQTINAAVKRFDMQPINNSEVIGTKFVKLSDLVSPRYPGLMWKPHLDMVPSFSSTLLH